MTNKLETQVISKASMFVNRFHHEILYKTLPYAINLVKHAIYFFLTVVILWFMIRLTEFLFPNLPLAVKILVYTSEAIVIIHFAKENIFEIINILLSRK